MGSKIKEKKKNKYKIENREEVEMITISQNNKEYFFVSFFPESSYIKINDNYGNELDMESELYTEILNSITI